MPYFISPVGNEQQFDANGAPLVGGKIYTYLAGSTTPAATYTDNTGSTPQANPIILNSLGVPSSPIWMLGGATLKFVIKTAADVTLRTVDNVSGINDVAGQAVNEWVASGLTPTYISGTSFSFAGDQTPTFQVNRRVLTTNTAGTRYGTIQTSVFSAGLTTITLLMDSGTLDSGLSAVFYGIISVTNTSLPPNSSAIVAAVDSRLLAPGPIGSTTPNTGAFTTLTATNGSGISALNASNLASGTVPDARFPATLPAVSGANLTNLPAANLTGNIAAARMANAFTANNSSNGYVTLPNGTIFQWGSNSVTGTSTLNVSLPVTFPNAFLQAFATMDNSSTSVQNRVGAGIVSTSQIQLQNSTGTTTVRWFAIGY